MQIQVLYFGMLAEITGQPAEQWEVGASLTVHGFRKLVEERYPLLHEKKFKIAINKHIAPEEALIPAQSELALLPPFAGG